MHFIRKKHVKTLFLALLVMNTALAGCLGANESDEETLRIAFSVRDDYTSFDENPQKLADYLSEELGRNVELYPITSDALALQALRLGSADMAFMDGGAAWMGWQQYGLEAMAADQKSDGRTYYNAHAYVLNDSAAAQAMNDDDDTTDPFAELTGVASCHTGWLKSAGMLIPMGFFIGQGYAEVIGDPEDIESLRNTIYSHFGDDASIPETGTLYYGYSGALRCLSEEAGGVAFAKDSSLNSYCGSENLDENEAWCLDMDRYVKLPSFGQAPSHPLMYQPDSFDADLKDAVVSALTSLNETDEGRLMLAQILNTPGVVATTTEAHLGSYGTLIGEVPGISAYLDEQYGEDGS